MSQNISQHIIHPHNKKSKHKIQLNPGWVLLYYKNKLIDNKYKIKIICGKYLPSSSSISEQENNKIIFDETYIEQKRREKIFDEYTKNINEYRNIRKELYDEDFSYLDKYLEETYEIYTENDIYSSDMDSCDENESNNYVYNKNFDL